MDHFRISRLEVNNIGPFGHLELDFPEKPAGMTDRAEIHVLTGENGTGKTTVLEMLVLTIRLNQSDVFLSNKFKKQGEQSNVKVDFGEQGGSFRFYQNMNPNLWSFPEGRFAKAFMNYHFDFSKNKEFSVAFFAYSGYRRIEEVSISGIEELNGDPFSGSLDFQKSIHPQTILQWIANTIMKEALAKNQSDVTAANRFRTAISNLEGIISQIIEKPVRFDLKYEPLNVVIEVDKEPLDFNILPDGLKSIVSWIADLLMRMDRVKWENDTPVFERNFILFLDEIEVHLHPAWQRKILPAVQKLFPNAQIFISTHSPFVVGSVDGAWIHKFVKPNGDSRLAGPPILSEDAKSFRYWLDEVFDIKKEFGEGAQGQLDKFYLLRNRLLVNGTPQEREEFIRLATSLISQSLEMESIISMELRQLNKRIQQPVVI
ncbi:MAG: AAA family ATPase [Saprospiraceae bacterium]|nr:AAA family ATPase [Saprospiraceae bacterium]